MKEAVLGWALKFMVLPSLGNLSLSEKGSTFQFQIFTKNPEMEDASESVISAAGVHEKVVKDDIHLKVKSMDKEPNDEKGAEIKEAESGNSTVPEKEKDARSLVRSNPFWEQLRSIVFCEYDPFP
ncbi:hypothetical protein D5086_033152 [Populus alba]|uniref:Uncharacterized protein n=1 Tax=Populus alba TaxID=43335 RepID=A0ACC4AG36_POPAL